MGKESGIEWTESTLNVVTGCDKVSQGCKNCYAERDWARLARNENSIYYGREFTDVMIHPERLELPKRWTKPRKIFVNSMSDLFHDDVPIDFIEKVYQMMSECPQHTFQILTKRAKRMSEIYASWTIRSDMRGLFSTLSNVWVGVSVENQETFDERVPLLLDTGAKVKWLSMEPLLGRVEIFDREAFDCLPSYLKWQGKDCVALDWVVIGGESGPKARAMNPEWVRIIIEDCERLNIPVMFKQWGEWAPDEEGVPTRVGKKVAGRLFDGSEYNGYPV